MRLLLALVTVTAAAACTERIPLPVVDAAVRRPVDVAAPTIDAEPPPDASVDRRAPDLRPFADVVACNEVIRPIETRADIPTVIIALDRSMSMFANRVNDVSRFAMVHAALRPVLEKYEGAVNFGYEEFPPRASACTGCCAGPVRVHPAPRRASLILSDMRCDDRLRDGGVADTCTQTVADSPAFQALQICDEYYDGVIRGPRYVLLVTDGDPTCTSSTAPCERTVMEAAELLRDGVQTIVVGVSEDAKASACLDRIALSGGMMQRPTPPSYFQGDTELQLRSQLNEAVSAVAAKACRISLEGQGSVDPGRLIVTVDGLTVPRDPINGWVVDNSSPGRIRFVGSACERVKSTDAQERVEVRAPCTQCFGTSGCRF